MSLFSALFSHNGNGNGTPNGNNWKTPVKMAQNPLVLMVVCAILVNYGEKPEKSNGVDLKRWQQKILFYLTTLKLARFLSEDASVVAEDEQDMQVLIVHYTWKDSHYLCRNYVLNSLHDAPYNVYNVKR